MDAAKSRTNAAVAREAGEMLQQRYFGSPLHQYHQRKLSMTQAAGKGAFDLEDSLHANLPAISDDVVSQLGILRIEARVDWALTKELRKDADHASADHLRVVRTGDGIVLALKSEVHPDVYGPEATQFPPGSDWRTERWLSLLDLQEQVIGQRLADAVDYPTLPAAVVWYQERFHLARPIILGAPLKGPPFRHLGLLSKRKAFDQRVVLNTWLGIRGFGAGDGVIPLIDGPSPNGKYPATGPYVPVNLSVASDDTIRAMPALETLQDPRPFVGPVVATKEADTSRGQLIRKIQSATDSGDLGITWGEALQGYVGAPARAQDIRAALDQRAETLWTVTRERVRERKEWLRRNR